MKQEIWKDISNFKGLYQISTKGRVYSIKSKMIMKQQCADGYPTVSLHRRGKGINYRVHILMAKTFLSHVVNHKDGNKENNNIENLEWVTQKENISEAIKMGTHNTRGSNHGMHKLTEDNIRLIRKRYSNRETPCRVIADEFGVSGQTINLILLGRKWKHI